MDEMVLMTQKWLNTTYGKDNRFIKVVEDGKTGWGTIHALTRALQIELGMKETGNNFGPNTQKVFKTIYPNGIKEQKPGDTKESNVYGIIQGTLWCKGYSAGYGEITHHFYRATGDGIRKLKSDMGLGGDSTVTVNIMEALLSMKQFVLLWNYGGKPEIRTIQQSLNRDYGDYIGIIPCDGLYGREMNKALIKVLQVLEGFSGKEVDGIFGTGTKNRLPILPDDFGKLELEKGIEFTKLVQYTLIGNGYNIDDIKYNWDLSIIEKLILFQKEYKLPQTGKADVTTWMSLLTSKGNPDRKAVACDTRFEITDELLGHLKSDGYKIVGRYLTGGDFKEIRAGELDRIIEGGLSFFPIFQESGSDINYFTFKRGELDAKKAREAAIGLGIPSTIIYFAVDMDVLDYQVDSHILPYFRGLKNKIGKKYKVGIYAPRNVCTRVSNEGYAESSFVSDMSSGFSGNLGFPIPKNWNYDQFYEIKGYKSKWDLDKVAYFGREKSVNKLSGRDKTISISIFDLINKISNLEAAYNNYVLERIKTGGPTIVDYFSNLTLYEKVMNILDYLRHENYSGASWFFTTNREPDLVFVKYMEEKESILHQYFLRYIAKESNGKESHRILDDFGGEIDLPHLAATIQGYARVLGFPEFWAGWGGDLATLIFDIEVAHHLDNGLDYNYLAESLIGAKKIGDKRILNTGIDLTFGWEDFCSDADAIKLEKMLSQSSAKKNLLSTVFQEYYNKMAGNRLKYYLLDFQNKTTINEVYSIIKDKMEKERVAGKNVMDILSQSGVYGKILGPKYKPSDGLLSVACMTFTKKILD